MLGALTSSVRNRQVFEIPDDAEGGWQVKAAVMRRLAQEDVSDLEMQERWHEAMRSARFRDPASEIRAWFAYVQKHVRYTPASFVYDVGANGQPVPRTQVIVRPAILFRRGLGDCVAMSTAAASGLAIAGYDSDFVFVSTRQDGLPSHVYLRVWHPARTHQKCTAFDATVPQPAGWEVPNRSVTWSGIVPVLQPWDGDSLTPSGIGGDGMMGLGRLVPDLVVERNKQGEVIEAQVNRSPFTGRPNDFSYAAWEGIPVPMLRIKPQVQAGGTLDVYATSNPGLPTVGDSEGPWDYSFPGTIAGAENIGDDAVLLQAHRAGLLEDATAKMYLYMARLDAEKYLGADGVSGWLDDLKNKVTSAVQNTVQTVQSTVQSAAASVQTAYSNVSTAVVSEANRAYNSVRVAGRSLTTAEQTALAAAVSIANKSKAQFHAMVNKLNPTPVERLVLYLAAGPAGFASAFNYAKAHQYELKQALPKQIREGIDAFDSGFGKMMDGLKVGADTSSGSVSGISGYYFNPRAGEAVKAYQDKHHIPGLYRFWTLFAPIGDSWANAYYHRLNAWERRGLIALLVVLLILTIVVLYYSGGSAFTAAAHGDFAGVNAAFHAFGSAIGFTGFSSGLLAIVTWIKGGSGNVAFAGPDPVAVPATVPPPNPANQAIVTADLAASSSDPSGTQSLGAKATGSFAAAAALGAVKAFVV